MEDYEIYIYKGEVNIHVSLFGWLQMEIDFDGWRLFISIFE